MWPTLADLSVLDFEIFLLIFIRVSFMVALLPVIGAQQVIPRAKIGLAFFLSVIIYMGLPEFEMQAPAGVAELFVLALKELFVGVLMGFSASILFVGLNIAGRIIDHNTGFSMIQSINPLTNTNESVIGQIQIILFSLILLVTGTHLIFIKVIFDSFEAIPVTGVQWNLEPVSAVLVHLTAESFVYGIKMAAPVLAPLLLTTTGLAIVARIMPQINVWLVGMPLKIGMGLLTVSFVLPLLWQVFEDQVHGIYKHQLYLLKFMGG